MTVKVGQGHLIATAQFNRAHITCIMVGIVSFLRRYSTSNNRVPFKSGLRSFKGIENGINWYHTHDFLSVYYRYRTYKYSAILYHFRFNSRRKASWPWNLSYQRLEVTRPANLCMICIHRSTLRTRWYLSAVNSRPIGLAPSNSTHRAPEKAV